MAEQRHRPCTVRAISWHWAYSTVVPRVPRSFNRRNAERSRTDEPSNSSKVAAEAKAKLPAEPNDALIFALGARGALLPFGRIPLDQLSPSSLPSDRDVKAHIERVRERTPQLTGAEAGRWLGWGSVTDIRARDQRADDGRCGRFCWTSSEPVTVASDRSDQWIDIVGYPTLTLTLSSDQPIAFVVGRLCQVHPMTGVSTLITRGYLNLTHRDSHEHPTALQPGQPYTYVCSPDAIADG